MSVRVCVCVFMSACECVCMCESMCMYVCVYVNECVYVCNVHVSVCDDPKSASQAVCKQNLGKLAKSEKKIICKLRSGVRLQIGNYTGGDDDLQNSPARYFQNEVGQNQICIFFGFNFPGIKCRETTCIQCTCVQSSFANIPYMGIQVYICCLQSE